jgi:signal transduction histidine kinase
MSGVEKPAPRQPSAPAEEAEAPPQRRETLILAEQIATMYRMSAGTRFLPALLMLVLGGVHWPRSGIAMIAALMAAYALGTILFDRLRAAFAAAQPEPEAAETWGRRFALLSLFTGATWGTATVLLFDADSVALQAFTAMVLIGLVTSAALVRGLYPPAFYAFALPAAVPFILLCLAQATWLSSAIGLNGIIGILAMVLWARQAMRSQRELIALRFENADLVRGLEGARRRADEARVRAETADRAKSEFLATMSHELRTPLNGVLGMAEVLQDSRLDADQRSYVAIIKESGLSLLKIINDILEFSRLEAGGVEIEEGPYDPTELIEQTVALMAPRAHEKGLEIEAYVDPALPARLVGDPARIRQVLLNLVGNAIKFTSIGAVTCVLEPAEIARGGIAALRCTIGDSGIGIAPALMSRLFTRFSQGDSSLARKFGGTGLGLAIAKRLVEAMGGTIGVDSKHGIGSRFWFILPLAAPLDIATSARPLAGRKLLLVAPPGEASHLTARKLVDAGAEVQSAGPDVPLDAALAADIVIVDDALGPESGAIARRFRAPGGGRPYVVQLVRIGARDAMAAGAAEPFNLRLLKPVRQKDLVAALAAPRP